MIQSQIYLNHLVTDNELKAFIEGLPENIDELFVYPSQLRRAKALLNRRKIRLGSYADYPLGAGTNDKIAFEVGSLFKEGADIVAVFLSPQKIQEAKWEELSDLVETVNAIERGSGDEVRYTLKSDYMRELDKVRLGRQLKPFGIARISYFAKDLADALHTSQMFRYDGGDELFLQMNLANVTEEETDQLIKSGVNQIGSMIIK